LCKIEHAYYENEHVSDKLEVRFVLRNWDRKKLIECFELVTFSSLCCDVLNEGFAIWSIHGFVSVVVFISLSVTSMFVDRWVFYCFGYLPLVPLGNQYLHIQWYKNLIILGASKDYLPPFPKNVVIPPCGQLFVGVSILDF
jgi:hypothetical protein